MKGDTDTVKRRLDAIEKRLGMNKSDEFEFLTLDSRAREDDVITKTYRIHESAVEEFNELIKQDKFKIYNVQDLISQAIWEFCKNNK